jgi:FKBP-type peptidyl-prolyl cis-trans isomerase SlyD
LALVGHGYGHGADFSQAGPADVQGGDAQEGALVLPVDVVIPQLTIEISQGPGQDAPILGEFRQEAANFRDFLYLSLANHFAAISGLRNDDGSVIIYRLYHEVKGKTTMSVIAKDNYVTLEYRLWLDSGEQLRGTPEAPGVLTFIAGCSELMPGLEKRLLGLRVQDAVAFTVPAAEAFGDYDPNFVQEWSHKVFPPDLELKPGQKVLPANLPFPPEYPLTVKEVTAEAVVLDMNHPLAGHDLRYEVKVVEVRPATPEELEPLKQCLSCAEGMSCEH